MKKILAITTITFLLISMVGCNNTSSAPSSSTPQTKAEDNKTAYVAIGGLTPYEELTASEEEAIKKAEEEAQIQAQAEEQAKAEAQVKANTQKSTSNAQAKSSTNKSNEGNTENNSNGNTEINDNTVINPQTGKPAKAITQEELEQRAKEINAKAREESLKKDTNPDTRIY